MRAQRGAHLTLAVPEADLRDLRARLSRTRWPGRETVNDWGQGAPLAKVRALCEYWLEDYDWRRCEVMLNGWGQQRTVIDGLGIHFLHIRSPEPDAMPIIMTHGWPGSVLEFRKVIGALTDPVAHGGDARDAFHLVLPSLPGYGFSEKPAGQGWSIEQTASAWVTLMNRLGYAKWVAQGGDWGADVTARLGALGPIGLAAIHLNTLFFSAKQEVRGDPSPAEKIAINKEQHFRNGEYGYHKLQGTRPQTLAYGLADSPVLQAAWIYEKFHAWSDNPGDVETIFTNDEMLDTIMLYWLSNAGASSARLYWEGGDDTAIRTRVPVGVSQFAKAPHYAPRAWAERYYPNIIHWNEFPDGGHFAAWERPEIFVHELRTCFRRLRASRDQSAPDDRISAASEKEVGPVTLEHQVLVRPTRSAPAGVSNKDSRPMHLKTAE